MNRFHKLIVAIAANCTYCLAFAMSPADVDATVDALTAAGYKEWAMRADKGDFSSPIVVGRAAQQGKGTKRDYAMALRYYRQALAYGSPLAAYFIAGMYDLGEGVSTDHKQAFKLYLQAANNGIPAAADSVGILYAQGRGVSRDMTQALKWHRQAADKGFAAAQSNVGYFYQNGLGGVKQDYAQALAWYKKAAEGGDDQGQYNIALMYLKGTGTAQNLREAEKWLVKAAEQDLPDAQNDLAVLYAMGGEGVPRDVLSGYKWYLIAAANGVHRGDGTFAQVKRQMTMAQLTAAKESARAWLDAH